MTGVPPASARWLRPAAHRPAPAPRTASRTDAGSWRRWRRYPAQSFHRSRAARVIRVDGVATVARGHELQRAHGAGVRAAHGQRIEPLLVRQQQELVELLAEVGRARGIVERQRASASSTRYVPVVRPYWVSTPSTASRYSGATWYSIAMLVEQLLVLAPELCAAVDAQRRQHARTIFPPLQGLLGGLLHALDDLRLRLGGRERGRDLAAVEPLGDNLIDERLDLGSRQIEVAVLDDAAPSVARPPARALPAAAAGVAASGVRRRGFGGSHGTAEQQHPQQCRALHDPTSLRWEYRPMRMPKPASSVTTDVPP